MARIVIARRLNSISVNDLKKDGVRLVTLDLDKILSEHKSWKIYDDAHIFVEKLQAAGIAPVIATNERNPARLAAISEAFGNIPALHRGLNGMRGKPYPDMLLAARKYMPDGKAVHIDDQLKAHICARLADYNTFIWVYPRGNPLRQNPGVMLFRFIELPIVACIWLLSKLRQSKLTKR